MSDAPLLPPPVARYLDRHPRDTRFLSRAPRIAALRVYHRTEEAVAARAARRMRQRVFAHCASREAEGESPLDVSIMLTAFADEALRLADAVAYRAACERVPLQGQDEDARAIFALGKLGGGELNPSSDIDVVPVCESSDPLVIDRLVHWVRGIRRFLSEVSPDGFCLRVDLDLRPDGKTGPLIQHIDAFERYYERFGRTWERIAWVRARPIIDVGGVGAAALKRIASFIRPTTGHAARVADTASIRARLVATQKGPGLDLKRCPGGIRDVEFVVQLLQVSFGRRFDQLAARRVDHALDALEATGLLAAAAVRSLLDGYLFWRRLEHAIQYVTDTQTQVFPESGPVHEDVLRFLRVAQPTLTEANLREKIARHQSAVQAVADEVFGVVDERASWASLALDERAEPEARAGAMEKLGFRDSKQNARDLRALGQNPASPFSPEGKSAARNADAVRVLVALSQSGAPDIALSRLADVTTRVVHSGWWRYVSTDERAARLLARIMALSGPLSRFAYRSPSVLVQASHLRQLPRRVDARLFAHDEDDEAFCHRIRRAHRDMVLTGALCFLDQKATLVRVQHALTTFVDVAVNAALKRAIAHANQRYGSTGTSSLGVLALGSLGARSLPFFGDLDLLFVWRGDDADREWAVRVGHRLLWLLSAPLGSGLPFQVDMRLRPSGNQGPLCVRDDAFESYHQSQSALWERQALLKLRGVAGDAEVNREALRVARRAFLRTPSVGLGTQLLDMRARMVSEQTPSAGFDLKLSVGGIADIDFAVQGHLLAAARDGANVPLCQTSRGLTFLQRAARVDAEMAHELKAALGMMTAVRVVMQLADGNARCVITPGDPRLELVSRVVRSLGATPLDSDGVVAKLTQTAADVRERTHRLLVQL